MGVCRLENKKKENAIHYFDYSLLAIVIFLICFGLVMLYSTSSYSAQVKFGDSMWYFKKQLKASILSVVLMLLVALPHYHYYAKLAKISYVVAFILMALVQTDAFGIEAYGARRWIRVPGFGQMQPAEVMKIAIVLLIPYMICKAGKYLNRKDVFAKIFFWGLVAAGGVYVLTDNLSTAVIVLGMVFTMLFVVHKKTAPFAALVVGAVVAVYVGARMLGSVLSTSENFRIRRILVWLNPEAHASEGGFQVMQGLYAIGSGGFFGKGLGNSAQKMIIPEVQNDMILSIICEELGVFGAIIVLVLFGMLLYRLLFIAQNAPDAYGALMVTGIFAHIAIQVILNVAVILNLIPTTGVTLPFISYGGTSILFLMVEMGLALNVSARIRIEE